MSDSNARLLELARSLVERARAAGASVAEASARGGFELSVRVRLGEPELVEEAGHHSVSLRVLRDHRVAVTGTSDLSEPGLARCVADALELCELSEADPFAGPADPSELAKPPFAELEMFDPSVGSIDAAKASSGCSTGGASAKNSSTSAVATGSTLAASSGSAAA